MRYSFVPRFAYWVHPECGTHWPYQRAVKLQVFLMGICHENTSHFKLHSLICQTSGKKQACRCGVKWSQNLVVVMTTARQKHKKMWLEPEFVVQINSACFLRRKRNVSVLVKPRGVEGGGGRFRTLGFWKGFTLRAETLVKSPRFVWFITLSST